MATKVVNIPEIGIVELTKKRGNKNIRLSITRAGKVRISMPTWVPYKAGVEFAINRADWIVKHKPEDKKPLADYMKIGKAHRLVFTTADTSRVSVRTAHGKIKVTHPATVHQSDQSVQAAAHRGALKALKQEADKLLPQRVNQIALRYGFSYKSVTTKRLVTRWGSCSQAKEIVLNIYLMQLPWHLIDYVITHELVHTEHLNHGEEFWKTFESLNTDAKKLRKELKQFQTIVSPESID